MTDTPERPDRWRHMLIEGVVALAFLGVVALVGSNLHVTIPPEWRHGWRYVLLYLAGLSGLILVILIVGVAFISARDRIADGEWSELILDFVGGAFRLAVFGGIIYVVWHFITKYW